MSSLIRPARRGRVRKRPERQGLRPEDLVDDDARVRQERRRVGEAVDRQRLAEVAARVGPGVRVRGRLRVALELVEALVHEPPLERRDDHQVRAAERAAHDQEQRDRQRRADPAREAHPAVATPSRNRYPAPRTVRISSGSRGVALDLLAQVPDVHVDRPRLAVVRASPDALEQLPPAEDDAGVARQEREELELDEGQLDRLAAHLHRAAREVDHDLAAVDDLVAAARMVRCRGAAQERTHAAAELPDREGLRDVVVGAELEPEHLVELVVAGGEHDDRHRALRAKAAADLESVDFWQHDVEDDEVDGLLAEAAQRLVAVAGLDDPVPVPLERVREKRLDRVLVVDEQDGRGRLGHLWLTRPQRGRAGLLGPTIAPCMEPARLGTSKRRPRRGSIERPVDLRLARNLAAFLALPLLLVVFTMARTGPLPAPDLPPAFDGATAAALTVELAGDNANRVPGSPGGGQCGAVVPRQARALRARRPRGRLARGRRRPRSRRAPQPGDRRPRDARRDDRLRCS